MEGRSTIQGPHRTVVRHQRLVHSKLPATTISREAGVEMAPPIVVSVLASDPNFCRGRETFSPRHLGRTIRGRTDLQAIHASAKQDGIPVFLTTENRPVTEKHTVTRCRHFKSLLQAVLLTDRMRRFVLSPTEDPMAVPLYLFAPLNETSRRSNLVSIHRGLKQSIPNVYRE